MTARVPRHHEIGDLVIWAPGGPHTVDHASAVHEVVGYAPDGSAFTVQIQPFEGGLMQSRKEALEYSGVEPRRALLGTIPVWQVVQQRKTAELLAIGEVEFAEVPPKPSILVLAPRNGREKKSDKN